MIKRPLNSRFREQVLAGRKTTTIREKAWPVGVPIMLYNWSGAAYRSKQIDVAAIVVESHTALDVVQCRDGKMIYAQHEGAPPSHESEGFGSSEEMDEWFRELVPPGHSLRQTLMRFRLLANVLDEPHGGLAQSVRKHDL